MDIHQARTVSTQEEMRGKVDSSREVDGDNGSRSRKYRCHDGGMSRKDGGHGLGGKSRRNRVRSRNGRKSLKKRLPWKLSELWRSDMGTGIKR
jgi:hypothetical protein